MHQRATSLSVPKLWDEWLCIVILQYVLNSTFSTLQHTGMKSMHSACVLFAPAKSTPLGYCSGICPDNHSHNPPSNSLQLADKRTVLGFHKLCVFAEQEILIEREIPSARQRYQCEDDTASIVSPFVELRVSDCVANRTDFDCEISGCDLRRDRWCPCCWEGDRTPKKEVYEILNWYSCYFWSHWIQSLSWSI